MTTPWNLVDPSAELARAYRSSGAWDDRSLGTLVADAVGSGPTAEIRVWSAVRPARASLAETFAAARRFAGWLVANGVSPGDVVAFQLPNCIEAAIVFWGAALAGAVVTPVVHFYGEREVRFILDESQPRVFVTADQRWRDLVDTIEGCQLLVALDEGGASLFAAIGDHREVDAPIAVDPAAPALLAYTSGTTSSPKGVVHTHRSLGAEMRQLLDVEPPDRRPQLVGAPVGHAMGTLGGLLIPVLAGRSVHLIDRWDPAGVLAALREGDLRFGGGSTYFLSSLLDADGLVPEDMDHIRFAGMGGSPVPAAVGHRAEAAGVSVCRCYGSTEHPTITHGRFGSEARRRVETDGFALPGVELRLVDDDERPVGVGEPGQILTRGPDLFGGYTDADLTKAVFDADGWYRTGDIGVVDEHGWLTITDRLQDIIIRGGENVSAAEVEEALAGMAVITEVAVVAAPDDRLGEHGCAFLRLRPGAAPPDLATVQAHLGSVGLAKQKWPEELRVVDDLPRTPSGKVKKFELRSQLREER